MWYFSWMLGLPLALFFGVLNALWYEVPHELEADQPQPGVNPPTVP